MRACGARRIGQAVLVTALVLAGNTLLRPLVNAIDRTPLDEGATEAGYEVRAVVDNGDVMAARDLLVETLEAAHHPIRAVSVEERGPDDSEIETAIRQIEASDLISQAIWTSATSD